MGSDRPPEDVAPMQGFSVSVTVDDPADADRIFAALADGGTMTMPIAESFWALRFGMLVDRFGTPWMVNCDKPS
jgi:PhnB protein